MRAEGKQNKEIREKTGFHTQYITVLVSRYKANGLASITESHYHGNHRNLSYAEEEALLEPFRQDSNRMKKLQKLNFSTFQFFRARGDISEMQQSTLADWCDLNTEAKKE